MSSTERVGEQADQARAAETLSLFARVWRWLGEARYNEHTLRGRIYWGLYAKAWCRFVRFAHNRGFHYAPLCWDDEGWHRWCQQCGMRESYKREIYELKGRILRIRSDYMAGKVGR